MAIDLDLLLAYVKVQGFYCLQHKFNVLVLVVIIGQLFSVMNSIPSGYRPVLKMTSHSSSIYLIYQSSALT